MIVSDVGLRLIAEFEGFSPVPYNDPAGHCTVGYGELLHLGNCTAAELAQPPITGAQGRARLAEKVKAYADAVARTSRPLTQPEFDALTSLCYNIGQGGYINSSVRRAVNNGGDVCAALRQYVKGTNGVTYPGLVRRREAECKLFHSEPELVEDEMWNRHNEVAVTKYWKDGHAFVDGEKATIQLGVDLPQLMALGPRAVELELFSEGAGTLTVWDGAGPYAGQLNNERRQAIIRVVPKDGAIQLVAKGALKVTLFGAVGWVS